MKKIETIKFCEINQVLKTKAELNKTSLNAR